MYPLCSFTHILLDDEVPIVQHCRKIVSAYLRMLER